MVNESGQRIAVIGAGISGIVCAHMLARKHAVTLFERNNYLGGHTNTFVVREGPDAGTPIDTGFIVCNPLNYPNFYKFLDQLEVARQDSDMSFAHHCEVHRLSYAGPSLADFFQAPTNFLRPRFLRLLVEQRRFNHGAVRQLATESIPAGSLGAFLLGAKYSRYFVDNYIVPLAAAIWSSPAINILEMPYATFIRFFKNHGMLEFHERPVWQSIVGGSRAYIDAFREQFKGEVMLGSGCVKVARLPSGIRVTTSAADSLFDYVVFATHADEALAILADPSDEEKKLLGQWRYHANRAVLHTDSSVLPSPRRLWASWNYVRRARHTAHDLVGITYYMNRLQQLPTERNYFVTLNPSDGEIAANRILYETVYTHPEFTCDSVATQSQIVQLSGSRNTYFCGAYLGYGFHEDGVNAALSVTRAFGLEL